MTYTALYLPSSSNGYNPTKSGFATEESAYKYIENHWCKQCRIDHAKYLKLRRRGIDCEMPLLGCDAEWMVISDEDYK